MQENFEICHAKNNLRRQISRFKNMSFTCIIKLNPLSVNFTKWSNTLKQFVGNLPTNSLSVFGHFVGLTLKGLRTLREKYVSVFLRIQSKCGKIRTRKLWIRTLFTQRECAAFYSRVCSRDFLMWAEGVRYGSSPIILLLIFITPFPRNSSKGLLLKAK